MKTTKSYLKACTQIIVLALFVLSAGSAVLLGIMSVIGLCTKVDILSVLSLIAAALISGLISSMLYDLLEYLNNKFWK